jgi:predicted transcriptional regulator
LGYDAFGVLLMPSRFGAKLGLSSSFLIRSEIDIMASILNEARKGARKTRIMYRCNLSYKQLQTYLKLLVGLDMLIFVSKKGNNTTGFFKTSGKGVEFLDAYRKLKVLMT